VREEPRHRAESGQPARRVRAPDPAVDADDVVAQAPEPEHLVHLRPVLVREELGRTRDRLRLRLGLERPHAVQRGLAVLSGVEGFARVLAVELAQDGGAARVFSRVTSDVDVYFVYDDHYRVLDVGLQRLHGGGVTLFSQRFDGALLQRINAIRRRIHSRIRVCVAERGVTARRSSQPRLRGVESFRRRP
jgi:hypothetical protein